MYKKWNVPPVVAVYDQRLVYSKVVTSQGELPTYTHNRSCCLLLKSADNRQTGLSKTSEVPQNSSLFASDQSSLFDSSPTPDKDVAAAGAPAVDVGLDNTKSSAEDGGPTRDAQPIRHADEGLPSERAATRDKGRRLTTNSCMQIL